MDEALDCQVEVKNKEGCFGIGRAFRLTSDMKR